MRDALSALRAFGLTDQRIFTGDRKRAAELIAQQLGISHLEAGLSRCRRWNCWKSFARKGTTGDGGDGLNNAAALATAYVGIAMAGASDVTAEAADVVFLPHSLERLPELFRVSRSAVRTAWQNIFSSPAFLMQPQFFAPRPARSARWALQSRTSFLPSW